MITLQHYIYIYFFFKGNVDNYKNIVFRGNYWHYLNYSCTSFLKKRGHRSAAFHVLRGKCLFISHWRWLLFERSVLCFFFVLFEAAWRLPEALREDEDRGVWRSQWRVCESGTDRFSCTELSCTKLLGGIKAARTGSPTSTWYSYVQRDTHLVWGNMLKHCE